MGLRVLVYGFNDGPVARTGRVFFVGVEFVGGGQADIGYAALDFKETRNNIRQSVIDSCSFTVCDSFCIRLLNNLNVTINNTVLYNGRKYMCLGRKPEELQLLQQPHDWRRAAWIRHCQLIN
jgi:hypothetical protein